MLRCGDADNGRGNGMLNTHVKHNKTEYITSGKASTNNEKREYY